MHKYTFSAMYYSQLCGETTGIEKQLFTSGVSQRKLSLEI